LNNSFDNVIETYIQASHDHMSIDTSNIQVLKYNCQNNGTVLEGYHIYIIIYLRLCSNRTPR